MKVKLYSNNILAIVIQIDVNFKQCDFKNDKMASLILGAFLKSHFKEFMVFLYLKLVS